MGLLQESKSRKRINNDPNNTKWTKDETTFGQRILRSQGWQPGQFLGAQDAPHSELHTSANASYIRVVLKDDMKGLGFNKAKEDEITGLDVFSDLLSRLNGRSEESIESDKQARLALKTNVWVERKYGPMRFVRGGLLVGDKVEEENTSSDSSSEEETQEEQKQQAAEPKSDKKRKAAALEEDTKSAKKSKKQKKQSTLDDDESDEPKLKKSKSKKDKKEKKDKKDKKKKKSKSKDTDDSTSDVSEDEAKRLKKAKKEEKRLKKEKKEKKEKESSSAVDTPVDSGASTPRNRNFVRSRFIAQKKQAVLDTKALNQIFMLKT